MTRDRTATLKSSVGSMTIWTGITDSSKPLVEEKMSAYNNNLQLYGFGEGRGGGYVVSIHS